MGEIIGVKNGSNDNQQQNKKQDQLVGILLFVDVDHCVKLRMKGKVRRNLKREKLRFTFTFTFWEPVF